MFETNAVGDDLRQCNLTDCSRFCMHAITYREKEKVLDQILSDFYTWKELHYLLPAHNQKGEK